MKGFDNMYKDIDSFMEKVVSSNPEQIEFHQAVKEVVESKNYQNQDRKTVNLFTQYNAPADIQPYFTTGSHGKTSITALIYNILQCQKPSLLCGAIIKICDKFSRFNK